MPESVLDVCREDETPALRSTGVIVLSASGRLLYIDQTAIDLLRTVDPDWRAPTRAQPVARCLMTVVQEIVTTQSSVDSSPQPPLARVSHLLGERSQLIRAQAFLVPSPQHERRIVLVLSPGDQGAKT